MMTILGFQTGYSEIYLMPYKFPVLFSIWAPPLSFFFFCCVPIKHFILFTSEETKLEQNKYQEQKQQIEKNSIFEISFYKVCTHIRNYFDLLTYSLLL